MKKILLQILIIASMVFPAACVWGEIFHVNTGLELQNALHLAEFNGQDDIIVIAPGTYSGNFIYESSEGCNIGLVGLDASDTIIDAGGLGRVLTLRNTNGGHILLTRLTLQNGNYDSYGGGLSVFTQNLAGVAGFISIYHTIIKNNKSEGNGGGVWAKSYSYSGTAGTIELFWNIIQDNEAGDYANWGDAHGGGVYAMSWASEGWAGNIIMKNNLISGNISARRGGGAYCSSFTTISGTPGEIVLTNNTVAHNMTNVSGGGVRLEGDVSGTLRVYNNIMRHNDSENGSDISLNDTPTKYGYNNNYLAGDCSWTYSADIIYENPLLTSDHHLMPSSPCIDAGTNNAPFLPDFDIDGQLRDLDGDIDGIATIDMGADEYFFVLPVFDGHDFDGNVTSEVSVWRPSNGRWYIKDIGSFNWGESYDIPVNGDYNGDGTTDIAVWRPENGRWYLRGMTGTSWGAWRDIPVPGDYDGDEVTDIAVWRPSNGKWYIQGIGTFSWGTEGDIPVPGDYDGDGNTDLAVYRPSNGKWYVRGIGTYSWGTSGDIPVPGDYDGDGDTDIVVWRSSNGRWYLRGAGSHAWGTLGDFPVPGDYNGDGITDIAVWRPSNGRWYLRGLGSHVWGMAGDIPLVR